MMVEEFFHCYRPSEITQLRGMYSFVPEEPLLRLVCDTPDSNRNWGTGRVAISLSKVANGRVTLVTKNTCLWTKPGALCPYPVCIRLYEVCT